MPFDPIAIEHIYLKTHVNSLWLIDLCRSIEKKTTFHHTIILRSPRQNHIARFATIVITTLNLNVFQCAGPVNRIKSILSGKPYHDDGTSFLYFVSAFHPSWVAIYAVWHEQRAPLNNYVWSRWLNDYRSMCEQARTQLPSIQFEMTFF